MVTKRSPVDDLGKNPDTSPDYSAYGRWGKQLTDEPFQISRHGKGGVPHFDPDNNVSYDKPAQGHKPKPIVDPAGKTVKLGNDQHGFLQVFQQAALKTGVTVPTHVLVLMSDAANAAAKTSVDDLRAHMERGTKGAHREHARTRMYNEPFLAALKVGEQHLQGQDLRKLMTRAAGGFRDGASHSLSDGTESPIPLPLASVARHHLTGGERRDGLDVKDILDERDKPFHDGLKKYQKASEAAAKNPASTAHMQAAAAHRSSLGELGKHHTDHLNQLRQRTKDEDAKRPAAEKEQRSREVAGQWDQEADANLQPMSDQELASLKEVVQRLVADPSQFAEVNALPNAAQGGKAHDSGRASIVRALEEAVKSESARPPDQRTPAETLIARTLVRAMAPRANAHISRAEKTGEAKNYHVLAHRDIHTDRHAIARAIVESAHNTPDQSICAIMHLDAYRVARYITASLPGPDDMLRHLTEQGRVKPKPPDAKDPKLMPGGKKPGASGDPKTAGAGVPPLILKANNVPFLKASGWEGADQWSRSRPRSGGGKPTLYRDQRPANLGAVQVDASNSTPVRNALGRGFDDDQAMRDARDTFNTMRDKHLSQPLSARDDSHIPEMVAHGTDLLHGPMAPMRRQMNKIGGPELVHRFLTHYGAHPRDSYDETMPHKHFDDHVGRAAGNAIADHLYDEEYGKARQGAEDDYTARRDSHKISPDTQKEIDDVHRRYSNPGSSTDWTRKVRLHEKEAHINNIIRNQSATEPGVNETGGQKFLRELRDSTRGQMDVMTRSARNPATAIFGDLGGRAMDAVQRGIDLRRAHKTALDAVKKRMNGLYSRAEAEQSAPAFTPTAPSGGGPVGGKTSNYSRTGPMVPTTRRYGGQKRAEPVVEQPPARILRDPRAMTRAGMNGSNAPTLSPERVVRDPRAMTRQGESDTPSIASNGATPMVPAARAHVESPTESVTNVDPAKTQMRSLDDGTNARPEAQPVRRALPVGGGGHGGSDGRFIADTLATLSRYANATGNPARHRTPGGADARLAANARENANARLEEQPVRRANPHVAAPPDVGRGDDPTGEITEGVPPTNAPSPGGSPPMDATPTLAADPPAATPNRAREWADSMLSGKGRRVTVPQHVRQAANDLGVPYDPNLTAREFAKLIRDGEGGAVTSGATPTLTTTPPPSPLAAPSSTADSGSTVQGKRARDIATGVVPVPTPPVISGANLTGRDARDAYGQSQEVATHKKLGTYVLHPHEDGYRISRDDGSEPMSLKAIKGHDVFPTKEEALDHFQSAKGHIPGYNLSHSYFGDTAAPEDDEEPTSPPPAPATPPPPPSAPTPTQEPTIPPPAPPSSFDYSDVNVPRRSLRAGTPITTSSTPEPPESKAPKVVKPKSYSVADLLAAKSMTPMLTYDRMPHA